MQSTPLDMRSHHQNATQRRAAFIEAHYWKTQRCLQAEEATLYGSLLRHNFLSPFDFHPVGVAKKFIRDREHIHFQEEITETSLSH